MGTACIAISTNRAPKHVPWIPMTTQLSHQVAVSSTASVPLLDDVEEWALLLYLVTSAPTHD